MYRTYQNKEDSSGFNLNYEEKLTPKELKDSDKSSSTPSKKGLSGLLSDDNLLLILILILIMKEDSDDSFFIMLLAALILV